MALIINEKITAFQPRNAPIAVVNAIPRLYQRAIKGAEPSVQWKE